MLSSKPFKPHDYQRRAVQHVLDRPASALFLDMGLGKTSISLSAVDHLQDRMQIGKVLVVAPLRVCTITWPDEARKWTQFRSLRIVPVTGSKAGRLKALATDGDIYCINYENFIWFMQEWLTDQDANPFSMIIFDESSKMKSSKARRFKIAKQHIASFNRRLLLTGTPAPQSYEDLWSQFYLLDKGERLGQFVTHFRDRYFNQLDQFGWKRVLKKGAAAHIEGQIQDLTLCLHAKDHLKMPKLIFNDVAVDLPNKARALYDRLEKHMFAQLMKTDIEVFNSAALTLKCRQVSAGFVYDENKKAHHLHTAKLDALADIIDDAQGTPILVAYQFKAEAAMFAARWPKAPIFGSQRKINGGKVVRAWNAGKIPVMFAHPGSLGHGMNLQDGGHILVWTSLSWSTEEYEQMYKRLYRQGQRHTVIVHHLMARETCDIAVKMGVSRKAQGQAGLLAVMRDYSRSRR